MGSDASSQASEGAKASKPRWRRVTLFWKDPRQAWLEAEIADLGVEADKASDNLTAVALIEEARKACARLDVDTAWQHVYRARQELVGGYQIDQLRLLATSLLAEAEDPGRLPKWRVKAIRQLLPDRLLAWNSPESATDETELRSIRHAVANAAKIRNQGIANDYWRLAIVRHYQTKLFMIGAPVLIAVLTILAKYSGEIGEAAWARGPFLCILSALIGVLGAVISAAKRSAGILPEHVLTQLGSNIASLSRIPIGAVAGLTVWLFSIATAETTSVNAANLLLAAFGAGFAERLIVQGQPSESGDQGPERILPR